VFSKEVTDHLGKDLTVGEWPVGCCKACIMTGNKCTSDD